MLGDHTYYILSPILDNVALLNKVGFFVCLWDLIVCFCNIFNRTHPLRKVLEHIMLQVGFLLPICMLRPLLCRLTF